MKSADGRNEISRVFLATPIHPVCMWVQLRRLVPVPIARYRISCRVTFAWDASKTDQSYLGWRSHISNRPYVRIANRPVKTTDSRHKNRIFCRPQRCRAASVEWRISGRFHHRYLSNRRDEQRMCFWQMPNQCVDRRSRMRWAIIINTILHYKFNLDFVLYNKPSTSRIWEAQ